MRTSKFTVSQIWTILRSAEDGAGIAKVASANGISAATVYTWRAKYGKLSEREMQLTRDMRGENARLKDTHAALSADYLIVKEVLDTVLSTKQRRDAVTWAVKVKRISQRKACSLLTQSRSTQRRSLRKADQRIELRPMVLVVEDDSDVRKSFGDMVKSRTDINVITSNGFLETATWLTAINHIDLLICSATLTGEMTGIDVAEIALKTFPNIGIVIVSSYEKKDIPGFIDRYTYLRKPCDREQLLAHLDVAQSVPKPSKTRDFSAAG